MTYLTLLITVPLSIFTVLFAISNTETVPFFLFPGDDGYNVPGYLLGLGMLALGFLSGILFVGLLAQRTQFRYWQEKNRAQRLEKELEKIEKAAAENAASQAAVKK